MAILATYSGIDMKTMTEVNVIRKLVNPLPRDWLIFIVIFCQFDNFRLSFSCDSVTVHAGTGGWNHGKSGPVNTDVTVSAIDFHCASMKFVRKGDRLRRSVTNSLSRWP